MFYKWQNEAIKAIRGGSAILSAPTGSGKTWVAYVWAGLMDIDGNASVPSGRVIFTAPIKALSNERYLELKSMGFDVGLEQGKAVNKKCNHDAYGNPGMADEPCRHGSFVGRALKSADIGF